MLTPKLTVCPQEAPKSLPATFGQMIESFISHSHVPAITFYHVGRKECVDYAELHTQCHQWAGFLTECWSLSAGGRVALCAYNETAVVPIALAVIASGRVLVPLNPDSDTAFIESVLDQASVEAVILGDDIPLRVRDYLIGRIPLCVFSGAVVLPRQDAVVISDDQHRCDVIAMLLFTSGTTGKPKGVALSQSALIANASGLIKNFKLNGTAQLAVMPLFHAHAFGFGLMTALLSGGHLVLTRGIDPRLWKRAIREQEVVYTSLVPSLLHVLLRTRVTQSDVPSLRGILVSSAPLATNLAAEFMRSSGVRLIHGWGLSEYTNFACCMRVEQDDGYYKDCLLGHPWPAVGHRLDATEIQIRNSQGAEVPVDQVGELWIRGPSVMREYFMDEESTREALCDGWLQTGDLGYRTYTSQGELYFITGRLKEIIIRAGEKIAPLAVEDHLRRIFPAWKAVQWAVVGYPNSLYGEEIGLYVYDDLMMDKSVFLNTLSAMPITQRPKIVIVGSEHIPVTNTGKVQRLKLQKHFSYYAEYNGPSMIRDEHNANRRHQDEAACLSN